MIINRHSILFKINITFVLSFAILLFSYILVHRIISRINTFRFIKQTVFLVKTGKIMDGKLTGIELIRNNRVLKNILKNGKMIFKRQRPKLDYHIELLEFKGSEYLHLQSKKINLVVKNNKGANAQEILAASWLLLNIILAFLWISIYRSIHPLSKFRNKMEEFKKGNINIDLDEYVKRKDEVGYIAKELKEAMYNVKKALNVRVWFIRNVAHELKTPITKGKIALELLKNENDDKKAIFSNIFIRLELLINELFAVEKIAVSDVMLNISTCQLSKIIERAKELLFIVNEKVKIDIRTDKDYVIKADFELLSIAVKNLLDNAIKFSEDKKVVVEIENGVLNFINAGQKPAISEELMFEPFSKDTSLKNKDGFGLGLYIARQILERHGFSIIYKYIENKNIFSVNINTVN
ncbi:MAG: ArsS family sensor histidine kinase [bacterium]